MLDTTSQVTVCTLWEKDFHKGVGTLVNSLVRVGYRGTVWAGYRGDLPPWAAGGLTQGDTHVVPTDAGVDLAFVKLGTELHFSQYKAMFMMRVMTEFDPDAQGIYYFDPDVFVLAKWSFFEKWLEFGVATCEDAMYPVNATHPLVQGWRKYAEGLGYKDWSFSGAALNSGLVGVTRESLPFIATWQHVLDSILRDFSTGSRIKMNARTDLFYGTDQDALSLASCVSSYPISWVGPDGMAFERGEWLVNHAYSPKPWQRRVLRDLVVQGHKPNSALRLYWDYAAGPLPVEPATRVNRHRWLIPLAALLGRFYGRT